MGKQEESHQEERPKLKDGGEQTSQEFLLDIVAERCRPAAQLKQHEADDDSSSCSLKKPQLRCNPPHQKATVCQRLGHAAQKEKIIRQVLSPDGPSKKDDNNVNCTGDDIASSCREDDDTVVSNRLQEYAESLQLAASTSIFTAPGAFRVDGPSSSRQLSSAQLSLSTSVRLDEVMNDYSDTSSVDAVTPEVTGPPQDDNDIRRPIDNDEVVSDMEGDRSIVHNAEIVDDDAEIVAMEGGDGGQSEEEEILEGKILRERRDSQRLRHNIRVAHWVAVILLVSGLIALVLLLVNESWNNGSSEQVQDTTQEQQKPQQQPILYPPFAEDLLTQTEIKGLEDVESASYKANAWMMQDPYLSSYSQARQMQRFYLVKFFYLTHGDGWFRKDHWLSHDVSECLWFNLNSTTEISGWNPGMDPEPFCDDTFQLQVLNLTANNLTGDWLRQNTHFAPSQIIFDISNNDVGGQLPGILAKAANLEVFSVSNNRFEGQMISGGGFAAFNVKIIRMDSNQFFGFSGCSRLSSFLPHLEVLNLTKNQYGDEVPCGLDACKNLTYVGLGHNLFTGSIPSELGLLTGLKTLDFSENARLTGTLPLELGNISRLELLDVSGTSMYGEFPEELCRRAADEDDSLQIAGNLSCEEL